MKILVVHNYYQCRGGEDQCFEDEIAQLESHGHEVIKYTQHNDLIKDRNHCLLYTSPSPRDGLLSRMPSSA